MKSREHPVSTSAVLRQFSGLERSPGVRQSFPAGARQRGDPGARANMQFRKSRIVGWLGGIGAFALVVPVVLACVLPRNLSEQMTMAGDEVVVGTVQSIRETTVP